VDRAERDLLTAVDLIIEIRGGSTELEPFATGPSRYSTRSSTD
jgi:hypothetical protein